MKTRTVKLTILILLALTAVIGILLGHGHLRLEDAQAARARFQTWYDAWPLTFVGGYSLLYVLVTVAAIPGGAVLTILAGALFGLWIGVLVIALAGLIGAAAAFLISRFLLRNWIERRFGSWLETINKGLMEEGAFYLFTLRMIHIIPFFIVNYAMGVTRIRLRTYLWATSLAMLPGTFIFVNAGVQFSQVESVRDILSWQVLGSLALLGLFPLAAKKIVNTVEKKVKHKKQMSSA